MTVNRCAVARRCGSIRFAALSSAVRGSVNCLDLLARRLPISDTLTVSAGPRLPVNSSANSPCSCGRRSRGAASCSRTSKSRLRYHRLSGDSSMVTIPRRARSNSVPNACVAFGLPSAAASAPASAGGKSPGRVDTARGDRSDDRLGPAGAPQSAKSQARPAPAAHPPRPGSRAWPHARNRAAPAIQAAQRSTTRPGRAGPPSAACRSRYSGLSRSPGHPLGPSAQRLGAPPGGRWAATRPDR